MIHDDDDDDDDDVDDDRIGYAAHIQSLGRTATRNETSVCKPTGKLT